MTNGEMVTKLIQEFSKDADIVGYVKDVEARIATTKGHYGDYLTFLNPYAKDNVALYIISEALKVAGADGFGVSSAVSLIRGK